MNRCVDDVDGAGLDGRRILTWLDVLGVASRRQLQAALQDESCNLDGNLASVLQYLVAEGKLRQVPGRQPALYSGPRCSADLRCALGLADLTIAVDRSLRSLGFLPRWMSAAAGSQEANRTGLALVRMAPGPTLAAFIVHHGGQQSQREVLKRLRALLVLSFDVGRFFDASPVSILASLDCRPRGDAERQLVSLVRSLGHGALFLVDHSRLRRTAAPAALTAPIWYHRAGTGPAAVLAGNGAPAAPIDLLRA